MYRGADQGAHGADREGGTIETRATTTVASAFARTTRPRCGTRVNVVSPLRWHHSEVMARIARIGRITDIGMPKACAKLP